MKNFNGLVHINYPEKPYCIYIIKSIDTQDKSIYVGTTADHLQRAYKHSICRRYKSNANKTLYKWMKEVIDEIQVNENKSLVSNSVNYFKDLVITSQIKSKALLDKNISSVNFKVITINKIVYLLGSAQNQSEIKAINELAAKTLCVKKVVSHIILDDK